MFLINEKLKNNMLQGLPEDSSNLKKALIIYKRLCQTLNYSMEFYLDYENYQEWFQEVDNLKYVDGDKNKDVCCFTFNAILLELLSNANVIEGSALRYNPDMLLNKQYFNSMHNKLYLQIDGSLFTVDATLGILDNNDLVLSKYGTHRINGWNVFNKKNYNAQYELEKTLNEMNAENVNIQQLEQSYILTKGEEYKKANLSDRFNLFLKFAKSAPDYSILSFNYLLKLKHLLFTESELNSTQKQLKQYVDLLFVRDKYSGEFKAIAAINPLGYINDLGYENFDSLSLYEISIKNRSITQTSREEIKNKLTTSVYTSNHGWPEHMQMVMDGNLHTFSDYDTSEALKKGNPIDWNKRNTHNKRKLLSSGEVVDWNVDSKENI